MNLDKDELNSVYYEMELGLGKLQENVCYLENFCKEHYDFSKLRNLLNSSGYINMNVEEELYKLKDVIDNLEEEEEEDEFYKSENLIFGKDEF